MTCRTLSRTRPSHIVRNISTASEYGIAYSNSVRIGPRLRLFSVIVALESAMRTLALFPLLLAISPSRIRIRRVTELFQSSFASKNLRSISIGTSFSAEPSTSTGTVLKRKTHASGLTFGGQRKRLFSSAACPASCPDAHRPTRQPACEIGRPQRSGWGHHLQDIFVTGRFSGRERGTQRP